MLASEENEHLLFGNSNHGGGAQVLSGELSETNKASEIPEHIGRYRVIREIGRGGMGVVYEAEQENPSRTIALKILPPGFANAAVLRRFQREADMLGRMRHPGITQIFEAGYADLQTATGMTARQPFIAMELVPGVPLDKYVQTHDLSVDDKLRLFAKVCDAIQHAHESGVIHRDLKPNNILIESDGQPKVLDFGVSRAVRAEMTVASLHTHTGQIVGTIPYMSPEQVQGDPEAVDERSDVYALGVVLYEMLAGHLPHDLKNRPIVDAIRVIQQEEPSRLGSVDRAFRGDIDTILAKALEKERHRRYQSPAALAADLRRYLAHEPLEARPVSSIYQLRKFARRNKAIVGGAIATMAACLIGAIAATTFALRANENAREARMQEAEATALSYRTSITAAAAALREDDVTTAENRLLDAPKALREWEWDYLFNRLDQSIQAVPVDPINKQAGYKAYNAGYVHIWYGSDDTELHITRRSPGTRFTQPLHVLTLDAQTLQLLSQRIVDNTHYYAPSVNGTELYIVKYDGSTIVQATGSGDVMSTLKSPPAPPGNYPAIIPQRVPTELFENHVFSFAHPLTNGDYPKKLIASPDGRLLAIWKDTLMNVEEIVGDSRSHMFNVRSEIILNAVFDPNGRYLVTLNADRQMTCFNIAENGSILWSIDKAHRDTILSIAISADGSKIATGGQDRVVKVWDAEDGQCLTAFAGHRNPILALCFNQDGTRIASASADYLRVWDISSTEDPNILAAHNSKITAAALSPDGSILATHGRDILLWDVVTGLQIGRIPVGWNSWDSKITWSPDGERLLVKATVIDLYSGERFELPTDGAARDHRFSPFGEFILSKTNKIHANTFAVSSKHPDLRSWNFGDSSKYLSAVSEKDGVLRVRDFDSLQTIRKWELPVSWTNLLFDNAQKLAVATRDRGITIFDVSSGEKTGRLIGHTDLVVSLAYIPQRRTLVSGSSDRTIRLWNLESMEEIIELRGHEDSVSALVVTRDGRTIFSASGDKTIRRWGIDSIRESLAARIEYHKIRNRLTPYIDTIIDLGGPGSVMRDKIDADHSLSKREREIAMQVMIQRVNRPPP